MNEYLQIANSDYYIVETDSDNKPTQWKIVDRKTGEVIVTRILSALEKKHPYKIEQGFSINGSYSVVRFLDGSVEYTITPEIEAKYNKSYYLKKYYEALNNIKPVPNLLVSMPDNKGIVYYNWDQYSLMKAQAVANYEDLRKIVPNTVEIDQSNFLDKSLWVYFSEDEKNQLLQEEKRRQALRDGDSGLLAPIKKNVFDTLENLTKTAEKNKDAIAVTFLAVVTGGVTASGGFGSSVSSYATSLSEGLGSIQAGGSIFPSAVPSSIGAAGVAVIDQGKKIIENELSKKIKPVSEATIQNEQFVSSQDTAKSKLSVLIGASIIGLIVLLV